MITKYPLSYELKQTINLSQEFSILTAAAQNGVPTLWVVEDTSRTKAPVEVCIVPTGGTEPDREEYYYAGTAFIGMYVWHVFVQI